MAKFLTEAEWQAVRPPLSHIRVTEPNWGKINRDIILKWIDVNCNCGWVYYDGKDTYVFEKTADIVAFKLWIVEDPFREETGEILVPGG